MKANKIDFINIYCNERVPQKIIKRIDKGEKIALVRVVEIDEMYGIKTELYNVSDKEFNNYSNLLDNIAENKNSEFDYE